MNAVGLLTTIGFVMPAALLGAQSQAPKAKPAFFIQLIPEAQRIQLGTKVKVKALVTSTADISDVSARGAMLGCSGADLVHVEMQSGKEPEKTDFYRRMLMAPGSCFSRELRAGGTLPTTYDLSAFYDLVIPGKYTVWVQLGDDVHDPVSGNVTTIPVRSNTANFELVIGK